MHDYHQTHSLSNLACSLNRGYRRTISCISGAYVVALITGELFYKTNPRRMSFLFETHFFCDYHFLNIVPVDLVLLSQDILKAWSPPRGWSVWSFTSRRGLLLLSFTPSWEMCCTVVMQYCELGKQFLFGVLESLWSSLWGNFCIGYHSWGNLRVHVL